MKPPPIRILTDVAVLVEIRTFLERADSYSGQENTGRFWSGFFSKGFYETGFPQIPFCFYCLKHSRFIFRNLTALSAHFILIFSMILSPKMPRIISKNSPAHPHVKGH